MLPLGARLTFSYHHQHIASLEQCISVWNEHLPAAVHVGDHGIPWPVDLPRASAVAHRVGLYDDLFDVQGAGRDIQTRPVCVVAQCCTAREGDIVGPHQIGAAQNSKQAIPGWRGILIKRRCPAQDNICKAIPACSRDAIRYVPDENEPLGGVIVFDYDKCDGCGQCAQECCGSAIEMR